MNYHRHSSFRTRRTKKEKNSSGNFFKIVIIAIFILILQFFYFGFWVTPGIDLNNSITFSISPNESLSQIASNLKKENIINSKILFLSYAKSNKLDRAIQSGVFTIPLPQSIPSVLDLLNTTPIQDKITIPEGYTIKQIDSLLAQKDLILPNEFINCTQYCSLEHELLNWIPAQSVRNLEGLLFPDTYFININQFKPEDLIYKMLNNFQKQLPDDYLQSSSILPDTNLYNILIMASIIEREVLQINDMQLVSGILWKRFASGWSLDADAALLYIKDDNIITKADLQGDSPYNIRKFKGFPPTPISNPGAKSLYAAFNPTQSSYWFYLTTLDTGKVIYAKDNDEHNRNKVKYLY